MASNCICCLFGSYRCCTAWAATLGLVQAIILLSLAIAALIKQLWDFTNRDQSSPVYSLLYVYYFYNPYGDRGGAANGLAFRTQILAYIYAVLSSTWLLLSIALLVKASRSRGSPWAHYTWGTVSIAIILADLISTAIYGRDIVIITDFESLRNETGYPIQNIKNVPWYTFLVAPLIMMVVLSKGVVFWIINIVCTCIVFSAGGRLSRKPPSRYSRRFNDSPTQLDRDRQITAESSVAAGVAVARVPPAILTRSTSPEQNQRLRTVNEELTARLQMQPSSRISQDRTKKRYLRKKKHRSGSPHVVGAWTESPNRKSSQPVSPEVSPSCTDPSSFSYAQGPTRESVQALNLRRVDSQPRRFDDNESVSSWIEPPRSPRMPVSPQSPLYREFPDNWWLPSEDENQKRPAQPKPVTELRAELRAQLPWSYFQAPQDLERTTAQSKLRSSKRSFDMVPNIPAPDYTMHLHKGRNRSSTRELRNQPVESPKAGLSRSASDVGRAFSYKGVQSPNNVYGAPFVITDAGSRSPHYLRRPITEYTGY